MENKEYCSDRYKPKLKYKSKGVDTPFFTSEYNIEPANLESPKVKTEHEEIIQEIEKYGTGKPKRIITKANIIHD